jgi:quercetin dioxygenase-like cupin family protein
MSEDVLKVAPSSAKVIFENDRIRVLQYKFKKGQKLTMHSHPANFVYALTSVKFKSISADGKTQTVKMKKGESAWSDGSSHAVENLAKSVLLQVELK